MRGSKLAMSVTALILTATAVLSGCSGSSSKSDPSASAAPAGSSTAPGKINLDKKYTIKVYQWGPKDMPTSNPIIQFLDKKFNIDLQVERVLSAQYDNALQMKIASGDLPDIFRYKLSNSEVYQNLQKDGYLMNFTDYANKYNLQGIKTYTSQKEVAAFKEKDGFYQLPTNAGDDPVMWIIRQDWLDKLGLKMPTNWDEFEKVMQAFKDNNLGGKNTVPIVGGQGPNVAIAYVLNSAVTWTGFNGWAKIGGKWTAETITPEYQQALKYWVDMYQKGLLDKEIFTNNETQENAKFVSGQAGVMVTGSNRLHDLQTQLQKNDPSAKLNLIIPWPAGPKGSMLPLNNNFAEPIVAVKKGRDEDFLARVADLVDYLHTPEGEKLVIFGVEGVDYNMQGDKLVPTDNAKTDLNPSLGSLLAMDTDYSQAKSSVTGELEQKNYQYGQKAAVSAPFNTAAYGSAASYDAAVNQAHMDWLVRFFTGKNSVDKDWNAYVKAMNDAGLAQITDAVQKNIP